MRAWFSKPLRRRSWEPAGSVSEETRPLPVRFWSRPVTSTFREQIWSLASFDADWYSDVLECLGWPFPNVFFPSKSVVSGWMFCTRVFQPKMRLSERSRKQNGGAHLCMLCHRQDMTCEGTVKRCLLCLLALCSVPIRDLSQLQSFATLLRACDLLHAAVFIQVVWCRL